MDFIKSLFQYLIRIISARAHKSQKLVLRIIYFYALFWVKKKWKDKQII